ncbi:unnamed protein product [Adineta ricciae]|uniref:DDE Tnp4 domain-containing protein n=1 Tax=Adineta ricciae TaxID=249248 RepID=A0A815QLI8_ADIRI|nr:unnamed protein product [Adineta ricciae]CAF1464895.1 unnamed protein product [Adineta ricciae]
MKSLAAKIIADKAYIGEEYVITQTKKPQGRKLMDENKNYNRDIISAREAIENINQRLETYAVLRNACKGAIDDLNKNYKDRVSCFSSLQYQITKASHS